MSPVAITTERLTLRAPRASDGAAVTAIMQDIAVVQWLTNPPHPYSLADAEEFIAKDHGENVYFVEDAQGLCGCISLGSELGYWLAQDRWGQGYMSEAAQAVLDHHFAGSDADVISGHFIDNARSRGVLLRMGFRDAGRDEHFCPSRGETLGNQIMRLTRADWEART